MADNTFDHLVIRSSSMVSLNDRFSKILEASAPGEVKPEPPVHGLCSEAEGRTVQLWETGPKQQLTRVAPPRAQRGGPRPRGGLGARLSSAALEDQFFGGCRCRCRCRCALWGERLLSRQLGWAGKVLGARPIRRAGYTPNRWKAQFWRKVPSKEVLDRQLDDYMSKSKRRLDAQLDAYMALGRDPDADTDDRKLYDSDCSE